MPFVLLVLSLVVIFNFFETFSSCRDHVEMNGDARELFICLHNVDGSHHFPLWHLHGRSRDPLFQVHPQRLRALREKKKVIMAGIGITSTRTYRGEFPSYRGDDQYPLHLDPEEQRLHVAAHQRDEEDRWLRRHAESSKMNHDCSRAKALILVAEAARLERMHLAHQRVYALSLAKKGAAQSKRAATPVASPSRVRAAATEAVTPTSTQRHSDCGAACGSPSATPVPGLRRSPRSASESALPRCGCLQLPAHKLLTPHCRVIAMLRGRIESDVEETVEALRATYSCDEEMLEDLVPRYGPEPEEIDAALLLRSVEERSATHSSRWSRIADSVRVEMSDYDAFTSVIRTLSVMRIFLEGSQNSDYGVDYGDRQRREAQHQRILGELRKSRRLFL
jgi:hypothetical protein